MKNFKWVLSSVLMLSSLSSAWAFQCPTTAEIINEISGKEPNLFFHDCGTYTLSWEPKNFGTLNAWEFEIHMIEAKNFKDAFTKTKAALLTLHGNPQPKTSGMEGEAAECKYDIGFGYTAFALQRS